MHFKTPKFKDYYRIHVFSHGVAITSDRDAFFLKGKEAKLICSLITGTNSTDAIVDSCAQKEMMYHESYYLLQQLENLGVLTEAGTSSSEVLDFFSLKENPKALLKFSVENFSSLSKEDILNTLRNKGWQVQDGSDAKSNFSLVFVDDYLDPRLASLNQKYFKNQVKWLLIKPVGSILRAGPLFAKDQLCWECIHKKLSGADGVHRIYAHQNNPVRPEELQVKSPNYWETFLSLLEEQLFSLASSYNSPIKKSILTWDPLTFSSEKYSVNKTPQCPVCGTPDAHNFNSTKDLDILSHLSPGKWRVFSVENMLERVEPFFNPVTGVVLPVNTSAGDLEIPELVYVHTAKHPFKMNKSEPHIDELYYMSAGKSRTKSGAKLAAICEGIERYSPLYHGDETLLHATYNELIAEGENRVFHPNELSLYSQKQFDERRKLNINVGAYNNVPQKLDLNQKIHWAPSHRIGKDGTIKEKVLVPASSLFFGMPSTESRFSTANSNGLSSGGSYEEAILYSFLELFERDAVAIWWYNRIKRAGVALDTIKDEWVQRVLLYLESIGRDVWILDVTNDLGVPTFSAISSTKNGGKNIIYGFGCHFDPLIAIQDALLELLQCLPVVFDWDKKGSLKNIFQSDDFENWFREIHIGNAPYLLPENNSKSLQEYSSNISSIGDGLRYCLERTYELGLTPYLVNLTRPEVGIDVTKVIIPGLRLFWHRFAPGRLYDVPVKLGWLPKAKTEEEMNPYSVAF